MARRVRGADRPPAEAGEARRDAVGSEGGGGLLAVCGTPIGNLEDITLRAVRLLREADVVFAEDTRRTAKLLARHGIRVPVVSCHEHNEAARAAEAVARVRAGGTVVLVTDAGMPSVSDPGARVVRAVADAGLPVTVVPGPSAVTAAVAVSGFPADAFVFLGFPPRRASARERALAAALGGPWAVVFFESPHRLAATLRAAARIAGAERPAVLVRELTKAHEEIRRGTLGELAEAAAAVRGEVTVVVGPPWWRPLTEPAEGR